MKKTKKVIVIIVSVLLALILALVATFFILTYVGKSQFHEKDTHISTNAVEIEDETSITYNGKKYTLNENIVSILVLGIDRDNVNENYSSGNNGQADVIFLTTIDTETKKACIIPISRETMVDVNLYTKDGNYAGVSREQLCLAYAYGNTTEQSSQNVLTSVKRLFYGINISSYVTIEMSGVIELTNLVGGVNVTAIEDAIYYDKVFFYKGQEITLKGENARQYIQYRGTDIEANSRRMARQKQFLSALINKTGNEVLGDFSKLTDLYTTLSPYFNTNVSFAQTAFLARHCLTMNFGDSIEYKTIEGSLSQGENWIEFEANEESLLQTVIDVFYLPKK